MTAPVLLVEVIATLLVPAGTTEISAIASVVPVPTTAAGETRPRNDPGARIPATDISQSDANVLFHVEVNRAAAKSRGTTPSGTGSTDRIDTTPRAGIREMSKTSIPKRDRREMRIITSERNTIETNHTESITKKKRIRIRSRNRNVNRKMHKYRARAVLRLSPNPKRRRNRSKCRPISTNSNRSSMA